jgi:hypothetical protein
MPKYRGQEYTFEPVCIFCGQNTEETVMLADARRKQGFARNTAPIEAPAHSACHIKRMVLGFGSIFLIVALSIGVVVPLISRYDAVAGLGCLLMSVFIAMPLWAYLITEWIDLPRRGFMRRHGFEP